jgi:putative two-component system response regulator
MMAIASEARDADTGEHVKRIQHYVEMLSAEMGLKPGQVKKLGYASILHDVGKIHVPDRILLKPGPLTAEERREMQDHTIIGERILSASVYFRVAAEVARSHHENWDGSGYPDGKKEMEIPLAARITHVADVFDALASPRVYKEAWPPEKVVKVIREERGTQFDPEVVDAFERLLGRGAWVRVGDAEAIRVS